MKRLILAGLVLFGLAASHRASAEVMQAQNSRVAVDVPAGFEVSKQFAGFQNEALQASFVIIDMPEAAFDQIKAGITPQAMAAKGVQNAQLGTLARAEPYVYFTGEQASPLGPVGKFILVFREGGVTAFITANVPKEALVAGTITPAAIEAAFTSARVVEAPGAAKPLFTLGDLGKLKDAGPFAGTARAYTLDGKLDPGGKAPGRTLFLVAPSLDNQPVGDPKAFAAKAMQSFAGATKIKVISTKDVTIGGLKGIASRATATASGDDGPPLGIYHVVLFKPEGGYFRMVGQTSEIKKEGTLAEFERIAATFQPVD
jgi:hypothetical protein